MKKVLLTGASGRIGAAFFDAYNHKYKFFLTDIREPDYRVLKGHQFVKADLCDLKTIDRLFQGQDTVVHLAGVPDPDAEFEQILPANILAITYLIEASYKTKVNRFVFASIAQTIEGYPVDLQISSGMEVAPAIISTVSLSAIGRHCVRAMHHNMACLAFRLE
jgi:uronate dehydrogenase